MKREWEYLVQDEEKVKYIMDRFNVSNLVAKVVINRGFDTDDKIENYLNPNIEKIYDPYLMSDMDKAVDRCIKAISEKQKILIYGDYDVDGITSITIVKKFLQELGGDVYTYLPNRLDEGYGLNKTAIDLIKKMNIDLMITVDCGISAIEEVDYVNEKCIDIIVTDHHECGNVLPNAIAVINPKREDSKYPFKQLAGVGVAFKFIQAMSIKLDLPRVRYLKYLDIVCIGTIADIVPLIDENRVIAKNGLELLKQTKNVGIKSLLKKCGFNQIDSSVISFGLSPRINACGRIGDPQLALDLFLTNDINEADRLSDELNKANIQRQTIEKKIFEDAKKMIEEEGLNNDPIIVIGKDNWHHGVIGIVASKLVELYYKPCILVCFEGEFGKASGRSIMGFDLFEAVNNEKDLLEKHGGHEMAVGLSINRNNFDEFRKRLIDYTKKKDIKDFVNIIKIDSEIKSNDISMNSVKELKILEPFGEQNPVPIFVYKNIKIDAIRTLSEDRHIKLNVKDNYSIYNAIGFNLGYLKDEFRCGDKVDIAHTLEINRYNNYENIQLTIKDIIRSI